MRFTSVYKIGQPNFITLSRQGDNRTDHHPPQKKTEQGAN